MKLNSYTFKTDASHSVNENVVKFLIDYGRIELNRTTAIEIHVMLKLMDRERNL